MTGSNKAAARRTFEEIFPACDVEGLAEVTDPDVVDHGARPDEPAGIQGASQTMLWLASVFADQRWEIHHVIGEGDLVAVHATYHGRQTGTFMGIPPTGREIAYDYVHILRFRDGKAVEHWSVRDTGAMMRQLGVAPGPAPTVASGG
jgi:predicted ester cyclase